jgi:hypothetical protein
VPESREWNKQLQQEALEAPMRDEAVEKAERENRELKNKLDQMHDIVKNSLVCLDVAVKVGMVGALYVWPMPQNKITQAVALAAYAIVVTIISKGLRVLYAIKEE